VEPVRLIEDARAERRFLGFGIDVRRPVRNRWRSHETMMCASGAVLASIHSTICAMASAYGERD
jgi:hypothetical protein